MHENIEETCLRPKEKEHRFSLRKKHLVENKTDVLGTKPKASSLKWRRSSKKDKSNILFVPSCSDIRSIGDSNKSLLEARSASESRNLEPVRKNRTSHGDRSPAIFRCNSEVRRSSMRQRFRHFSLRNRRLAWDEVSTYFGFWFRYNHIITRK